MHSKQQEAASQAIAAAVKELMERHGVGERQTSKTLAQLLDLSYSQAHRKLNSGLDWTIGQLRIVAEHFGESLASIGLENNGAGQVPPTLGEEQLATFVVVPGQHAYPCKIWVGEQLHTARKVDFVAYQDKERWCIVEAHMCTEGAARHKVHKFEMIVKQPVMPSVAIVDDERGFADNLCDYLNQSGFRAAAFYSPMALERKLHDFVFNGYILDWILGERTGEDLIKKIRHSIGPLAPIFLLTGEVATGMVDESELARVIMAHDVQCREKPVRLPTFTAELLKALGA